MKKKIIILGAAGRDFCIFNYFYRNNSAYEVVAFTATQIPDIANRNYPAELSGKLYPKGIPILPEEQLPELIKEHNADAVVFAYSDVSHEHVMHLAAIANAAGADFILPGKEKTLLKSSKPVISVCAVRTGSGKSQTSCKIYKILQRLGKKVVAIRHPMPYGDLAKQAVQRFSSYEDLKKHNCTIEEIEDYEPYIASNLVVFSGVDYEAILKEAEKEADIIIWDGGNNDTSFYKPDLLVVVADPRRAGHELKYYPGETNFRMANVIIINKEDSAKAEEIETVKRNAKKVNPNAKIIDAFSPVKIENPELIKGKKVLVVEDGPTLTHGGLPTGAGTIAAEEAGAAEIVDASKNAVGSIAETFKKFPHLKKVLPAMGYGKKQMKELQETINKTACDAVVIGTPIDLGKFLKINKPIVRVTYDLQEKSKPDLEEILEEFLSAE